MIDWIAYEEEENKRRGYHEGFRASDYTGLKCKNCGRNRVMNCANGKKVCEKCGWDNVAGEYSDLLTGH